MMTPIVVIIRACARYKGDEDDDFRWLKMKCR